MGRKGILGGVVSIILLTSISFGQESLVYGSSDWDFVASPEPLGSSFFLSDNHYYDETNKEYVLTTDKARTQLVKSTLLAKEGFCARDYLIDFEAFLGAAEPSGTYLRFGVFYEADGTDPQVILELDTYQDGGPSSPWTAWEIDANHVALETQLGSLNVSPRPTGYDTSTYSVKTAPFDLGNGNWMKGRLRFNKGYVAGSIDHQGNVIHLSGLAEDRVDKPVYLAVMGSGKPTNALTNPSPNFVKVRNIKINILEDCKTTDLAATVKASCGNFNACTNSPEELRTCANKSIETIKDNKFVSAALQQSVLESVEVGIAYCEGQASVTCPSDRYDEGFSAGAATIDQKAIKDKAFADGIASVDLEAAKKEGYDEGVASIDVVSIKDKSYKEGVASVDVETLKRKAFQEGIDSVECTIEDVGGKEPGTGGETGNLFLSETDARKILVNDCGSCENAANHGRYVSCNVLGLNDLFKLNLISKDTRDSIHKENVASQCGKKDKRPDDDDSSPVSGDPESSGDSGDSDESEQSAEGSKETKLETEKGELDSIREDLKLLKEVFRQLQKDMNSKKRELRKQQKVVDKVRGKKRGKAKNKGRAIQRK